MGITTNLKKSDGVDIGNNLFCGNGTSNGNQTFNIIQSNGIDVGRGWYNQSSCSRAYGNIGFKTSNGTDIGTFIGAYGTLNCNCNCTCDQDTCDSDADGCFVCGMIQTTNGFVEISELCVGDVIVCADNSTTVVVGISKSVVGNRTCIEPEPGYILTDDHVVVFNGIQYCHTTKLNKTFVLESETIRGRYNISDMVELIEQGNVVDVDTNTVTYSPICDKHCTTMFGDCEVLLAGVI